MRSILANMAVGCFLATGLASMASAADLSLHTAPSIESPRGPYEDANASTHYRNQPGRQSEPTLAAIDQDTLSLRNPNDPAEQWRTDNQQKKATFSLPALDEALRPLEEFRDQRNAEGLLMNISLTHIVQGASSTVGTEDTASGIEFVVDGTWTPIGFGTDTSTTIGFETFGYWRAGTDIPPIQLGRQVGSLWPTAVAFDDTGMLFGQLWLQQRFNNKIGFRIGRFFPITAYDFFPLKNFRTDFVDGINSANLVIPLPASRGLGAFVMYRPVQNVYVKAGINDANSSNFSSGFETFNGETFKILEVGFDPGIMPRQPGKPPFGDVHMSLWQQDARKDAGIDEGWGIAFSASQRFGDYLPFLRYGFSKGGADGPALLAHSVNLGLAIDNILPDNSDRFGASFSWGRPADPALNDQMTIDAFYRHQLTKRIAVTPLVQYIIDPVNNPDNVLVGSLRVRFHL